MEPIKTTLRYRIYSKVSRIQELKSHRYVRSAGPSAEFIEESFGWYLFLEGSWEGLHVGDTKPTLEVGDDVTITIRKVNR